MTSLNGSTSILSVSNQGLLMNKLTLEEKRIRIIEFCKWEDISDSCRLRRTTYQCVVERGLITIGDPFEDLNAMHEAEKVLTAEQQERYYAELAKQKSFHDWVSATATQRAEALGLTLNLWEQGQ
jgi:hypothetical protein